MGKSKRNVDRLDKWSYGGVVRRDARHTHDGGEEDAPHRSKKKSGCKKNKWGNHVMTIVSGKYSWDHYRVVCIHCNKDLTWGMWNMQNKEWQSRYVAEHYYRIKGYPDDYTGADSLSEPFEDDLLGTDDS